MGNLSNARLQSVRANHNKHSNTGAIQHEYSKAGIATKEDLTPGSSSDRSRECHLSMSQCGWLVTPELDVYFSALDIPDIGQEQGERGS